jgi:hypothetical protein
MPCSVEFARRGIDGQGRSVLRLPPGRLDGVGHPEGGFHFARGRREDFEAHGSHALCDPPRTAEVLPPVPRKLRLRIEPCLIEGDPWTSDVLAAKDEARPAEGLVEGGGHRRVRRDAFEADGEMVLREGPRERTGIGAIRMNEVRHLEQLIRPNHVESGSVRPHTKQGRDCRLGPRPQDDNFQVAPEAEHLRADADPVKALHRSGPGRGDGLPKGAEGFQIRQGTRDAHRLFRRCGRRDRDDGTRSRGPSIRPRRRERGPAARRSTPPSARFHAFRRLLQPGPPAVPVSLGKHVFHASRIRLGCGYCPSV